MDGGNSRGTSLTKLDSYYPQPFIDDALATIAFLKSKSAIDHDRIGLWESSEGGMLTTQVAAQSERCGFPRRFIRFHDAAVEGDVRRYFFLRTKMVSPK